MWMVGGAGAMIAIALGLSVWQLMGRSKDPGVDSRRRVAIDAATGEGFEDFAIRDGDTQPWKSPRTGERTGFPAEACFWTREGGAKLEPTWVLLNQHAGKQGPTLCPECGREVVPHNPVPPAAMMSEVARARRQGG